MVKVCALTIVLLLGGQVQGAMVYLDSAFASETVAEDSTGINQVSMLAANDAGFIWGSKLSLPTITTIDNGAYTKYAFPSPGVGSVTRYDQNHALVGSHGGFSPNTGKLRKVDTSGSITDFATFPANYRDIRNVAASPVNGSVMATGTNISSEKLFGFDSSGNLLWQSEFQVPGLGIYSPLAYSPNGQGYMGTIDGGIYSVDALTGEFTLLPHAVGGGYAAEGYANIHSMAFVDDDNLLLSLSGNNESRIVRLKLSTGQTDVLVHWDFEIPFINRYLSYTANGLYLNSFDPASQSLMADFGLFSSFAMSTDVYGVQLLQGDFLGEFSGINALSPMIPEPGSLWLLFGLLAPWMKRDAVRNRHNVRGQRGR